MKQIGLYILLFFFSFYSYSQNAANIFGVITDSENNAIENVSIKIVDENSGSTTNANGEYSIDIPPNRLITIWYSHTSYESQYKSIQLQPGEKLKIDLTLTFNTEQIAEIFVESEREREINRTNLSPKVMSKLPGMGINGITSSLKTLPGVSSTSELTSQYNVRGGNFDENLIYVNDIPIYKQQLGRTGQQEGLSFVNSDMISTLSFSSGGFDVCYGDKVSSVLDITYKRPTQFEATADLNLMGATLHVGDANKRNTFSHSTGIRYRNTSLLLNSLDEAGVYKPIFVDIQSYLSGSLNDFWRVEFLLYLSNNSYNFVPTDRETTFGSLSQTFKMDIDFDGQEDDNYTTYLGALSLIYTPHPSVRHMFSISAYLANEEENYDIRSSYGLYEMEVSENNTLGDSLKRLANGEYLEHGRNSLNSSVSYGMYNGKYIKEDYSINWGLEYKYEYINHDLDEWTYVDSAGYNHPYSDSSISFPKKKNNTIEINNSQVAFYAMGIKRFSSSAGKTLSITGGIRGIYNNITNEILFSPRMRFAYFPKKKSKTVYRFSTGIYYQPPYYKEFISTDGEKYTDIKSQRSVHYVLGMDHTFNAWNRPFKLLAEIYYKNLSHIIPYTVDNVKIEYKPELSSHGYAAGLDLRLNGEFIKGTESWASLSFLKTQEQLNGTDEWIRRPTDQLVNFGLFFQDYFPGFQKIKMNVMFYYGTKLPTGPSKSENFADTDNYEIASYSRVDLGASIILYKNNNNKSFTKTRLQSIWLGLEIFNLLDISNNISYLWIEDVSGNYYGIPNYLTSRRINIKLTAKI